jgi:CHAD domain-containing protein
MFAAMPKPSPVEGGLGPEIPVEQAARRALAARLADVRRYEEAVHQGGDIDGVHDMRVATRRLRAAIALFDEAGELEEAKIEIKRLGDALGQVRDLDVQSKWLGELLAAEPEDSPARAGIQRLLDEEQHKRPGPEAALRQAIDRFRGEVAERLSNLFACALGRGKLAGHRERERLSRKLKRLARSQAEVLGSTDPHTAHLLRIQAKKLRYHAELLEEALPDETGPLLEHLQHLQELLGDLHDADVRRPLVESFLVRADPPDQPGALSLLRGTLEARDRLAGELAVELRRWQEAGFVRDLRNRLG